MDYIKSYEQINEELKRKLSSAKLKKQREDEEKEILEKTPADQFTLEEIKDLKHDDFDISDNKKEAKSVEKYHTFVIKKSLGLYDEVNYHLIVTENKDANVIYEKTIKVTKRAQHHDTLDFMLDKCAYIIHSMKEKAMKELDPYGEESWEESDKDKAVAKRAGELAEPEPVVPKTDVGIRLPEIPVTDEQLPEEDETNVRARTCPSCGGYGRIYTDDKELCTSCNGSGLNDNSDPKSGDCEFCNGEGHITFEDECDECGGTGTIEIQNQLKKEKRKKIQKITPSYDRNYGEYSKIQKITPSNYDDWWYDNKQTSEEVRSLIKTLSPEQLEMISKKYGVTKKELIYVAPEMILQDILNFKAVSLTKERKKKPTKKEKEVTCWNCKGWEHTPSGNVCDICDGTGKIKVDKDYKGPTWIIGGSSDYSYGS
jgi:rRNA maturation endonuclease Nob1